jgi:hypothetical protein
MDYTKLTLAELRNGISDTKSAIHRCKEALERPQQRGSSRRPVLSPLSRFCSAFSNSGKTGGQGPGWKALWGGTDAHPCRNERDCPTRVDAAPEARARCIANGR